MNCEPASLLCGTDRLLGRLYAEHRQGGAVGDDQAIRAWLHRGGYCESWCALSLQSGTPLCSASTRLAGTHHVLSLQPPARQPARSPATNRIVMQATPAVVSIRVQPPQSVTVGDVFSVSVFVGIASGAPVAQVCPTLSLSRIGPHGTCSH